MFSKIKKITGPLAALILAGTLFALPAQARLDEMVIDNKPYGVDPVHCRLQMIPLEPRQTATQFYRVKAGDTLWELAGRCGVSMELLAAVNGFTEDSILYAGQVIELPVEADCSSVKYTVKPGDNLYGICRRYRVTMAQLLAANSIKNPDFVKIGQTLTIPLRQPAEPVVPAMSGRGLPIPVMVMEWPLKGEITSPFGIRKEGRPHHGVDIAAPCGAAIRAPREGVVVYSGYYSGYGNTVIIDHGYGTSTLYAHCSKLYVKCGQRVGRGSTIATVGNTGRSFGPHLHWEVRYKGVPFDPTFCIEAEKLYLAAGSDRA
ncbi:LysM repeat protein [Desulfohalotomaculum tongense]|uniref:peptidoglycan DD-metalloendopeptidase family protein n=1 Tax=Desulforadius tongensis TaxID=1216062 RepID=UPI00195A2CCC|nr:M23 family metallopeptidase [Desulforadius tongensis]MBM7853753.1 LysM repeat protein [Desulforadius tongensis]